MALTGQQQTLILQLTQAMFNATPGIIYLEALGSQMNTGQSLAQLAQSIAGSALFFGKNYATDLTPKAFADTFINDFLGANVSANSKTLATDYVVSRITAGATQGEVITEVTHILSAFSTTDPVWGAAVLAYNTGNATKVVDNLVGDTVATDDKTGVVDYILAQMASGQTFGAMVEWAITLLNGIDHADTVWGNAAVLFDNRIEVSHYYSIEKAGSATNLAILQQFLASVTIDPASIATAKAEIDNLFSNPAVINLANLNGSNGFRLEGVLTGDRTGFSVSDAGDINGDGFDDVIVGAPRDTSEFYSGASFLIFGKASGFNASQALSNLDGVSGFRLNGVAGDGAGHSVSSAGDINGDGFDDLIIGAPSLNASYMVFGKASRFGAVLELSNLDGSDGFRLHGDGLTGWSVSSAGDVNGDGFDDVIVGAPSGSGSGPYSGVSYVVFGKPSDFSAILELSDLDGSNGFRMNGVAEGNQSGNGVSAGDVNGDGFGDLMIGAYRASPNGDSSGSSYVVFGKSSGFDAVVDLINLNGSNGFRLDGVAEGDQSGYSLSTAGDINGDGFDDIIIGAHLTDANGEDSGASYVIFGKASGFSAELNLSSLDGSNGFRLEGVAAEDFLGKFAISSAGDFNGDGFDDLIVGSFAADSNGVDAGASYVVFGKASGFNATLNLFNLDSGDGLSLHGVVAGDALGQSVSGAGDVNGDGFDDLIISALFADTSGGSNTGASYVIFGGNFVNTAVSLKTSEFNSSDVNNQDVALLLVGVNMATDFI